MRSKQKAIRIFMWNDPDHKLGEWSQYTSDMSSMTAAATSFRAAMKIAYDGIKRGSYTHFILSYPIDNWGRTVGNPWEYPQV
jgi:hypothetical protein